MVKEGIILGHKVLGAGIEVDKAKIEAISKLPYPANVKAIRSFLGHAGFDRRFIKDFSQVARPMTLLLVKDAPFNSSKKYIQAFDKAQAFPTSDAQNVVNFLKRLFTQFRIPKALISDRGTHLCNYQMEKAMKRLFPRKLKSRWYRPFSVSKDMKNGAIELYDEDGNEFIVNKQRVKPYQKTVLDANRDDDITLDDEGEFT
ncbi:reverse transcriptase domain-containing protein [Tanacetum coccineum]